MPPKSLLQSIREKELETNVNLDTARREAAEMVDAATRDAAVILERSEREAARAAEEYTRQELAKAEREVALEKRREMEKEQQVAEAGKSRVPEAVLRIMKAVIPD
jgi:vacuolar-type H+-ATPase subunit H